MAGDVPYTLGDYFDVARRRWIWLATVLPGAMLIAVYLAFTLPTIYRSSATILLESSSIPENLIRTTVTDYANQRLELVQQRVLTPDNLESLVAEIDPYPDRGDMSMREKARQVVQDTETERVDPFTLEPLTESNALSIYYYNPDPEIAQQVTSRLADMFLAHTRESRTQQATETYQFLQEQSRQAIQRIREVEARLAEFKDEYGDALPEAQARNQQSLDRAERELDTLNEQLLQARERRRSLEIELRSINPTLFNPDGGWREELAALQEQLALARQRYTEEHPTVRRLLRSIQDLNDRIDPSARQSVEPDNPEYIQVENSLDAVRQEIASLEARAQRTREQITNYERRLEIAPNVERQYSQIQRELQVAQERFAGIEASLSEAQLGQLVESEARGDRLTLLRPASRPGSPYSPNRLGIILLGLVIGGGLAVGLAALIESMDPTIRSARDLSEITEIQPLAAVPVMANEADRRKRVLAWVAGCAVTAIAIVFLGSTVSQAAF